MKLSLKILRTILRFGIILFGMGILVLMVPNLEMYLANSFLALILFSLLVFASILIVCIFTDKTFEKIIKDTYHATY